MASCDYCGQISDEGILTLEDDQYYFTCDHCLTKQWILRNEGKRPMTKLSRREMLRAKIKQNVESIKSVSMKKWYAFAAIFFMLMMMSLVAFIIMSCTITYQRDIHQSDIDDRDENIPTISPTVSIPKI